MLCLVLSSFALSACSSSNEDPLSPTSPSSPTPSSTVTIAAPGVVGPVNDEQWGWLEQPVALTVNNAVVTGTSATPITYEFDIASDSGFTQIIHNVKGVAQDATGKTHTSVPKQTTPIFLYWRARATNGTVTGPYSSAIRFELEGQGGHVSPAGKEDRDGTVLSEDYASAILYGLADEFPHTLAVTQDQDIAEGLAEELLLRYIWHLKLVGFDAARQRNPSGAISKDKLNIFIRGTWRTYDVFSLGFRNVATTITGLQQVTPPDPQFDNGIPD